MHVESRPPRTRNNCDHSRGPLAHPRPHAWRPGAPLSPTTLVALQRAGGNQAVSNLIAVQRDDGGVCRKPSALDFLNQQEPNQSLAPRPAGPGPGVRAGGDVAVSAGATMTAEATLREVYSKAAREISEAARDMVRNGTSPEEAARWANGARNDLKAAIRQRGSTIVKGLAEARNMRKYGNKLGPTYDELIRQGKTPEDIIGKTGRADTKVTKITQKMRVAGRFLIAVDIAIVTWDVIDAEEGQRLRTAVKGAGGVGGALGGGWAGMKVGGAAGSFFGPVGTAVGGFLGGVGGALAGGWAGRKTAEKVYDWVVEELVTPNLDNDMRQIDAAEDAYIRSAA